MPKKEKKSLIKPKKKKKLKKLTVGFEVEFFILNKKGKTVNKANILLNQLEKEKKNKDQDIVGEVGMNMIEVKSYPYENSMDSLRTLIDNIKDLIYAAEERNLLICPLGTYPGKINSKIRSEKKYKLQEKIFGTQRFKNSSRACGFHLHFELPWGVFDSEKLELKKLVNSKNKDSLVFMYNFLIAVDPVITTFMQSSPFIQGKHLGKDSRMLLYRGSPELENPDALYANYPKFGALPSYKHTGTDIIRMNKERYWKWFQILKKMGITKANLPKYKSKLATNWTPVKVNPHGTLEQRGMDMNHILIMFSIAVLLRRVVNAIQNKSFKVKASDAAIKEPFKLEKKTILIPPDIYVKTELQKAAAYKGLENDTLWYYCKRLLWLVKQLEKGADNSVFNILEKMIDERKTISDQIIDQAKKLGHTDLSKDLPNDIAAQIAIEHSKRLFKEIVLAEEYAKELD